MWNPANRIGIMPLSQTILGCTVVVSSLVHHDDFIREITAHLSDRKPVFKRVYTTNEERYLAVLPKEHLLPKNLQLSYQEVIDHLIQQ